MPSNRGSCCHMEGQSVLKFSITISSYLMPDFCELNCVMVRHVFGSATPILISDDRSVNSEAIEAMAKKHNVAYVCSDKRRQHFCGDVQSWANALAFGESAGADVCAKVSFRFIFLDQKLCSDIEDRFGNHICSIAVPSKIRPGQILRRDSMTFSMVPCLSDVIFMKVGELSPSELIDRYRAKVTTEKSPHSSLVEALAFDLVAGKFKDKSITLDELSFHQPGVPHRYLRKCQNHQAQYVDLASKLGITGTFDCREWNKIEGVLYKPKPVVV